MRKPKIKILRVHACSCFPLLAGCCRGGVQEEDAMVLCRRNMPLIRGAGRMGAMQLTWNWRPATVAAVDFSSPEIAIPFHLAIDPLRPTTCGRNDGAWRARRGFPSLLQQTLARCRRNWGVASLLFSCVLCLDVVKTTGGILGVAAPSTPAYPHDAGDRSAAELGAATSSSPAYSPCSRWNGGAASSSQLLLASRAHSASARMNRTASAAHDVKSTRVSDDSPPYLPQIRRLDPLSPAHRG